MAVLVSQGKERVEGCNTHGALSKVRVELVEACFAGVLNDDIQLYSTFGSSIRMRSSIASMSNTSSCWHEWAAEGSESEALDGACCKSASMRNLIACRLMST